MQRQKQKEEPNPGYSIPHARVQISKMFQENVLTFWNSWGKEIHIKVMQPQAAVSLSYMKAPFQPASLSM